MYKEILDNHKNGILILDEKFQVIYTNKIIQNIFKKATKERCGELLECLYQMKEKKRCMETSKCSDCNIRKNLVKVMNGELKKISVEKVEYEAFINGENCKVEMGLEIKRLEKNKKNLIYLEIFKMKTEKEVLISTRRFIDEVLDTLDDYIFYKNEKLLYVYANKSYCDYIGVKKIDLIGKSDSEIFPEEYCKEWKKSDKIALENGTFLEESEYKGRYFKIVKNKIEVDNVFLIACTIKDITFEKLEIEKAYLDNLTTLGNRRAYDKKISEIFVERDKEYVLALMDLDYLREINNELGHSCGDSALKKVAEIIKREKIKNIYRIGGDEFALVISKDEIEKIYKINENIKKEKVKDISLSSSIGVIQLEFNDGILKNFNRVDKALYKAKQLGRGRVIQE